MARPPVAKLMDYGKFKYESALKARESRKNQAQTVIKEIKLRPKIDPHDYGTKKGHVERFLKQGDKVKVTIMFRGREQSRPELGFKLLQRLAGDVEELGFVESTPKQDGRNMIMVIGPHKRKTEAMAAARADRPIRSRASASQEERAHATMSAAAELADAELADAEFADAEFEDAELADAELADVELADAELADTEPAEAEPAESSPARASADAPRPALNGVPDAKAQPRTQARPAASAPTRSAPPASRPAAAPAEPARTPSATPRPAPPRSQPRPGPSGSGSAAPKPTAPRSAASPAPRPGASGAAPRPMAPRGTTAAARPGPARRPADAPVPSPRTVAADKAEREPGPGEQKDSEG
jgi:translation initiation factor IF-3